MNSEGLTLAEAEFTIGHNAPERFYVAAHCIGCMVCVEIAPQIFLRQGEEEAVLVGRQPVGEQEIALCLEAAEICPVEAIGEQGEKVTKVGSELK